MSQPEPVEVRLPDLGLSAQSLTIGDWRQRAGSYIVAGDSLVEILSSSAAIDIPSPATGVVVRVLVETGQPVQDGQALALIRPDAD